MRSEAMLRPPGRGRIDQVTERLVCRNASEAAGFPLPQVVLDAAGTWVAKKAPRLPARFGKHRNVREFLMRILGTVASSKPMNDANDLPARLEAFFDERRVNQVRDQRIGGDKNV